MGDAKPILSEAEVGLITSIVQAVPSIGSWIAGLISGEDVAPAVTRRVAEILPERSASQAAADELG